MDIRIKYFSEDYPRLEKLEVGNWIDLRFDKIITHTRWESVVIDVDQNNGAELIKHWYDKSTDINNDYIRYKKGDILFLGLGVAMELPKGYEAYVVARSSTFKKTGLILTNGQGIIDNAYCGDNDEWKAMVYATRDGIINRHQRLFQFRIQEKMPELNFIEVDELGNKDRGGYGSTGTK